MSFNAAWTEEAAAQYAQLRENAKSSLDSRQQNKKQKPGKAEGLFKQVHDCIQKLLNNPRHPGLRTHKYDSLENPYDAAARFRGLRSKPDAGHLPCFLVLWAETGRDHDHRHHAASVGWACSPFGSDFPRRIGQEL